MSKSVAKLEAEYLAAQGAASTEYCRFAHSKSTTYGPMKMVALQQAVKVARDRLMAAKFGPRDRSKD